MPGDEWQKFANLRMFYAWMYGQPGKKLVVHGRRIRSVERMEPRHQPRLAPCFNLPQHDGLRRLVQHLNYIYKSEPALWQQDDSYEGFEWIDFHDADNSVISFLRKSREGEVVVFIVNATPVVRHDYRLGVPHAGFYREIINTDAETYGGSNVGNFGGVRSEDRPLDGTRTFHSDSVAAASDGRLQTGAVGSALRAQVVMSSGNVTCPQCFAQRCRRALHPFKSGQAAILKACPACPP